MNKDSFGLFLILILLGGLFLFIYQKDKDFIENLSSTRGKITNYYNTGGKKYIEYSFFVRGKQYKGRVRVSSFKCSDGTKGCVGKDFKILYSSKNPNNNDIYLEKYQKYKFSKTRLY
jgi:hypothetical protein